MPKSKVRSKSEFTEAAVSRTPVKVKGTPTPRWYLVIMFGLMLLGLAWLVVNYLAGNQIPLFQELGAWNYLIGFGLFIVGLLMTMGWK